MEGTGRQKTQARTLQSFVSSSWADVARADGFAGFSTEQHWIRRHSLCTLSNPEIVQELISLHCAHINKGQSARWAWQDTRNPCSREPSLLQP